MVRVKSHHQGPGDPPPRSNRYKRRASSLASNELTQQSVESSQGAFSANGRRTATPEIDDEAHYGRKKRVKRAVVDDHDQLNQELQDAVNHTQESVEPILDNVQVLISSKPQKRARFSEPPPTTEHESTTPVATPPRPSSQAPTGLTPYLAKIGAFRTTKSGRHARFSLPATLEDGENGNTNGAEDVREIQFTPLRAVLDGRIKRRLRRSHLSEEVNEIEEHKKDDARDKKELRELRRQVRQKDEREKELMLELELQRQMSIDITDHDNINNVQAELDEVRQDLAELKAASIFSESDRGMSEDPNLGFGMDDGVDHDDEEEELVLVDPDDINVSQEEMRAEPHVNGFYSSQSSFSLSRITNSQSISEHASQVKLPNPAHEADLRNFEEALGNLRRELSDARTAMDIISMELRSLGFADDHAAADAVLQSIRTTFREARLELEALLPGNTPPDLKNGALLKALTDHIYGLMAELKEKTELAEQHNQMEKTLRAQNNGLINKLADFETRNTTLEQRWTTLEGQNQKNIKTIGELEGELQTMHTALDEKDKDTSEKEILINGFQDEVAHQSLSIQRLQKALENYRDDVSKLEALVTHVEEEHKAQIEQMAQDHANVVLDLEMQLANETEAREEEQTDSDQKTQFINTLEAKIEAAEADLDNFRAQVSRVQDLAEAEKANREAAETEIDQQNEFIAELEGKIASAEKSLETLNIELEELRSLADSERRQRETAEQDIDDRNARIADLEIKIRDQGIQANELRSKLFEVQNNMEHEIAELKADIQARDEYYKDNMDKEKTKVSNAEQESARRNVLIAELELDIAKKEEATEHMQQEHDDLVAARDEDIARLIEDLATLETNYSNLKDSTDVQMTTLHSTITELTKTIQARDETIAILQDEAIATAEQNQSIIAEQDKKIDGLSTDLADARDEISNLTALKASLEKRVETTSTELLNIVDNHTNVLEKLNNIIKDRNEEIEALNTAAAQRTEEFKTQFEEKTEELNTAHFEATERTDYIERLTSDLEELKEAFATSQQDSADTITALREGMRAALERADTLAEAHAHRAVEARGVVDKMRVEGVKVAGAKIDLQRVVEGRVGKKGKKGRRGRRVVDSGIGVEDNEEEVFNGFGEEGEAVIGY